MSRIFSNRVCATSLAPGVEFPPALFVPDHAVCRAPYVWRSARGDDFTCVSARSRRATLRENAAPQRFASADGGCRLGTVPRAAFEGDALCVPRARAAQVRAENLTAARRRAGG